MRALLAATATLAFAFLAAGCCGKKSDTSTTTTASSSTVATAATTAVQRGQVEPVGCKGMTTAADCTKCCDPQYWRASFAGGHCACVKK